MVDKLPEGDEWLYDEWMHEVKVDGYRASLVKNVKPLLIRSSNDDPHTGRHRDG